MEKYSWFGEVTTMLLDYSEVGNTGLLSMKSKEIYEQQKRFDEENAKKGAETGF